MPEPGSPLVQLRWKLVLLIVLPMPFDLSASYIKPGRWDQCVELKAVLEAVVDQGSTMSPECPCMLLVGRSSRQSSYCSFLQPLLFAEQPWRMVSKNPLYSFLPHPLLTHYKAIVSRFFSQCDTNALTAWHEFKAKSISIAPMGLGERGECTSTPCSCSCCLLGCNKVPCLS